MELMDVTEINCCFCFIHQQATQNTRIYIGIMPPSTPQNAQKSQQPQLYFLLFFFFSIPLFRVILGLGWFFSCSVWIMFILFYLCPKSKQKSQIYAQHYCQESYENHIIWLLTIRYIQRTWYRSMLAQWLASLVLLVNPAQLIQWAMFWCSTSSLAPSVFSFLSTVLFPDLLRKGPGKEIQFRLSLFNGRLWVFTPASLYQRQIL